MTCAEEKNFKTDLIEVPGIDDLNFGERLATKMAWNACRNMSGTMNATTPGSSASASKMPEGSGNHLRKLFKEGHGFNMSGSWLAHEEAMALIYVGLIDTPRTLFVLDTSEIQRESYLSQKPSKGTLVTDYGVEQMDYSLNQCTDHPTSSFVSALTSLRSASA